MKEEEEIPADNKWGFIKSTRFWSYVLIGLSVYLFKDGFISEGLATFISTVAGGFSLTRTIDRTVDTLAVK